MLALALVVVALQQQQPKAPELPPLPPQVGDTSPFRRLALPAPNLIRTGAGTPGPQYWQQRADYTIRASLDTATHTITGRETIRYTNHSPDTLRYIWLQLDQNIYREDSRGGALTPPGARFAGGGFVGGYTIEELAAVRRTSAQVSRKIPLTLEVNGTTGRVELDEPLPPAGTTTFEVAYHFQVPEHGSDRMGREQFPEGWLYEIAQWYPRLAVYDDVRGWNTEQYLGQGEFYLEYGDFDIQLTVPRSFIVVSTGTLLNPAVVLTATERARLAQAVKSDQTVPIIARSEVGRATTRPAGGTPTLTWHFEAKNVRDVAWAAAPNFIWDASGWEGVLIQSLYPLEANGDWQNSTAYARHSIQHYSTKWFHYPYPVATNVGGLVGGMEYPMIVFCEDRAGGRELFSVETHELGHQWFPMVVGSNERLYAWMDEGFNTFINVFSRHRAPGSRRRLTVGALRRHRPGRASDAPRRPGTASAPRSDRVQQARDGPLPPASSHPRRHVELRPGLPRIHSALGLQASGATGLLPQHGGRTRRGPVVVLAGLVLSHRRRRSGGRLCGAAARLEWRALHGHLSLEPGGAPDARGAATHPCRPHDEDRTPAGRGLDVG
jgi:hypothetical protein